VAGLNAVKHPPVLLEIYARGDKKMKSIDLEPMFSTKEIPGKCIKCLAEHELGNTLIGLLKNEGWDKELEERFGALLSFLKSPLSRKLRDKTEKYLAEGKEVKVKIYFEQGKPRYRMRLG
jgi:hypothetical protein